MNHNLRNDRILPQMMDELSDLTIEHESLGRAAHDGIDYCSGPRVRLEGDFLGRLAEVVFVAI